MSAALRRDVFDIETIRSFAATVQTPEALKMLTLFTYADIDAVHPVRPVGRPSMPATLSPRFHDGLLAVVTLDVDAAIQYRRFQHLGTRWIAKGNIHAIRLILAKGRAGREDKEKC